MLKVVVCICIAIVWNPALVRGVSIPINGVVNAPFSDRAPTIDGMWTNFSEWADAQSIELNNELNETANIRIKHNGTYIFVLIDFITDFTHSTFDQGGICFDTKDNGGSLPEDDDYLFAILAGQGPKWVYSYRGTGSGSTPPDAWSLTIFDDVVGQAGFSKDQYGEGNDHRIYEWQIPCKHWQAASSYGFYLYVYDFHDKTFLEWPVGAGGNWTQIAQSVPPFVPPSPEQWGTISGDFVPEFNPELMFVAFAAYTAIIGTLVRKARRSKSK
jgi:hypothetical protein